jgi:hypothetical protein
MTTTYHPELTHLVKFRLGVRASIAINTTIRDIPTLPSNFNATNPRTAAAAGKGNAPVQSQPFWFFHADYTPRGARCQLRAVKDSFFADLNCEDVVSMEDQELFFQLKAEIHQAEYVAMKSKGVNEIWNWNGEGYKGPRWGILSVWRPLEVVKKDPLAVMDMRDLLKDDGEGKGKKRYLGMERVYKDRPGFAQEYLTENLMPMPPQPPPEEGGGNGNRNRHDWFNISEQTPVEVHALKLFDSGAHKEGSEVVPCAAHSAFRLPGPDEEGLRRSVEVRMIVIW